MTANGRLDRVGDPSLVAGHRLDVDQVGGELGHRPAQLQDGGPGRLDRSCRHASRLVATKDG
jgi:hypothetical protein